MRGCMCNVFFAETLLSHRKLTLVFVMPHVARMAQSSPFDVYSCGLASMDLTHMCYDYLIGIKADIKWLPCKALGMFYTMWYIICLLLMPMIHSSLSLLLALLPPCDNTSEVNWRKWSRFIDTTLQLNAQTATEGRVLKQLFDRDNACRWHYRCSSINVFSMWYFLGNYVYKCWIRFIFDIMLPSGI